MPILLQVTQGAKDMDALCAEIEDSPYAFEIQRTDDGELLCATYQHNYVLAQVEPQEIQSRAELEAEYQEEIARFQDSLEKLGSDPEMAEDISRTYAQSTREQAYRSQVSGIVRLGLNSDLVGTDLDKRSARFLTVDTAGRQALFDRKMAGKKDRVVLESCPAWYRINGRWNTPCSGWATVAMTGLTWWAATSTDARRRSLPNGRIPLPLRPWNNWTG